MERMDNQDSFESQKKLRKAAIMVPQNFLKKKVGSGGIDEAVLLKAQTAIENNTIDFKPIGMALLDLLEESIKNADVSLGEPAIEAIIYPAMQLKAQGTMFHYALVTDISNILVNFLETVEAADKDVLEVVIGHKKALYAVLNGSMQGDGGALGRALHEELMGACNRYYKTRGAKP